MVPLCCVLQFWVVVGLIRQIQLAAVFGHFESSGQPSELSHGIHAVAAEMEIYNLRASATILSRRAEEGFFSRQLLKNVRPGPVVENQSCLTIL